MKLPKSMPEACAAINPLLDLNPEQLQAIPPDEFKERWTAICFAYTGLHPDEATAHGESITQERAGYWGKAEDCYWANKLREWGGDPRLDMPIYERSGWPVVLAPIVAEAWRRFKAAELSDTEFYNSEAALAGMDCPI